jgi:pyruvate/2-oxoglutarate/acetoin dehydrogenase E1 component
MNTYFDELVRSMEWLANKQDTIFLGQSVAYEGTGMFNTLKNVHMSKRLELPVAEYMQMGMSTGLALNGYTPISIFPRWNFLLCAMDQIINHLDKISLMSDGGYTPKVIIRTAIGSTIPLDPQEQHKGDFTEAFQMMCKTINVVRLDNKADIFSSYQKAYERDDGKSTILVEIPDLYSK